MSTKTSQHIGTQLKKHRTQRGMTQAALAQAAGTNINYYAKLERGVAVPSLATLEKLALALKVHSSDLLPF
ncbi:MAG TPA: helix-turn-helix transcriptional regulator [Candidatus Saccharimonadia bacterium]|jgi:transcriptional regulator with XRE-family HTH domain|nr:helix-turn-helix transcriptional regulator [Candidatus Saccharimonadia bacterium]